MRRRRPRKGRGDPPPREATVIRVLIARRQLCFMRRSSRDITFLSLSLSLVPAFSYIIYYIGVLNACTFLFRQTVNIIFDVAPFMRQTKEVEMFLRNRKESRVRTTTSVFARSKVLDFLSSSSTVNFIIQCKETICEGEDK